MPEVDDKIVLTTACQAAKPATIGPNIRMQALNDWALSRGSCGPSPQNRTSLKLLADCFSSPFNILKHSRIWEWKSRRQVRCLGRSVAELVSLIRVEPFAIKHSNIEGSLKILRTAPPRFRCWCCITYIPLSTPLHREWESLTPIIRYILMTIHPALYTRTPTSTCELRLCSYGISLIKESPACTHAPSQIPSAKHFFLGDQDFLPARAVSLAINKHYSSATPRIIRTIQSNFSQAEHFCFPSALGLGHNPKNGLHIFSFLSPTPTIMKANQRLRAIKVARHELNPEILLQLRKRKYHCNAQDSSRQKMVDFILYNAEYIYGPIKVRFKMHLSFPDILLLTAHYQTLNCCLCRHSASRDPGGQKSKSRLSWLVSSLHNQRVSLISPLIHHSVPGEILSIAARMALGFLISVTQLTPSVKPLVGRSLVIQNTPKSNQMPSCSETYHHTLFQRPGTVFLDSFTALAYNSSYTNCYLHRVYLEDLRNSISEANINWSFVLSLHSENPEQHIVFTAHTRTLPVIQEIHPSASSPVRQT
ncbi:uncharacterized protein BDR25DRAFT_350995 [Lindgomyces ingoldianus]|uniref:Uncharacterized protein n=1 Tax=Lindgomyces ingoldianus TaxID=673940 RepID=A0ACB6R7N9_9PLEO|nr:uncharacterized protein BDR25DRAFT_350995 [Lindgomyces ingoldianus]KAF2474471.1 hypothetical protein BDR25DRAFT_350995 [Lindgomyces ingoldianus]